MARLAKDRDTYLSRDEIIREALALMDATGDVSTRKLASALNVTPTAIYHHFRDKRELVLAIVDSIWQRAVENLTEAVGDPTDYAGDPVEFFVQAALAVRRAFAPHPDAALYIAMTAETTPEITYVFGVIASQLGAIGVPADRTDDAFYTFTTYVLGSVLLVASRLSADEYLARKAAKAGDARSRPEHEPIGADDEQFVTGVRAVLAGLSSVS